jgi:heme-degrading monooxygenase HmoA
MIIRVFGPTIRPGKEREFEAFLRDTAVPLVSQQAGLLAQHVGRPRDPSSTEYVYVTVWEDVESIRAFAGERWQQAVIAPDEEHLLKDTSIGHYEVLLIPDLPPSRRPRTRLTANVPPLRRGLLAGTVRRPGGGWSGRWWRAGRRRCPPAPGHSRARCAAGGRA